MVKGGGIKRLGKGRVKVSNYLALWQEIFRHLSRKLRKITKFSTSLNALLGAEKVKISPIGKIIAIIMAAKVEQLLQKPAKYSTALDSPLGLRYLRIAPIEFFIEFLQYAALSTQPATHMAVMREAYGHHYGCQS